MSASMAEVLQQHAIIQTFPGNLGGQCFCGKTLLWNLPTIHQRVNALSAHQEEMLVEAGYGKLGLDGGIWTMTDDEFKKELAGAWDSGAEAYESRRARDESLPLTNPHRRTGLPGLAEAHGHRELAEELAAALGKATVVHVHHHDIEAHAASYNEGYNDAVMQGLAADPSMANDWFQGKIREARAKALEDAADAWRVRIDTLGRGSVEMFDWLLGRAAREAEPQ